MENAAENSSIKSQAETPKTPNSLSPPGPKKQVGFAKTKPTLVIPPPSGWNQGRNAQSAQTIQSAPTASSNHVYNNRKASVFMFDQFQGVKDFTKSGLGIGERCAYCVYNRVKSWSKKWFTHMFLTIVLTFYTIGGALVFEFIEGRHEIAVKEIDLREKREYFAGNISVEWRKVKHATIPEEWEADVRKRLIEYEKTVMEYYEHHKLLMINPEGKVWTFWNAIVYCGTICTTIEIMETSQTPPDQRGEENDSKTDKEIDVTRIEALVTAEQELSASVSRRRRTFTKKRSRERDPTPVRHLDDKIATTTDEDAPAPKPKTPERRRRRRLVKSNKSPSKSEPEVTEPEVERVRKSAKVKKSSSIPKQIEEFEKRASLADAAQAEVISFFNRTKKSLTAVANRGRDRFKKVDKEVVKRSQSAPHTFTEEELIESFRKAQLLDPNRIESAKHVRKYSDSSLISTISQENNRQSSPKQLRPEVIEFVRQRKRQRSTLSPANKIVEILDPKTSNIIATRRVLTKPDFNLFHLFTILRIFSIRELIANYKTYKSHMKAECDNIRKLRNRCTTKLLLIVIFCGLGGFLFKFVEGSFEFFYKCGVKRVKRDFIDLLWSKSHNMREEDWKSLARNKLKNFEDELHTAHEAGVKTYSGQRSWSFLNAVLYCLTTITTIGYGHIYPTTITGKALTIVYAIIGIPLFLLALTDFGKLFTRCIKFLWSFVRRVYYTGSCRRARKTAHVKEIFKGAQMMYEIATFRRPSMFVDAENPPPPDSPPGDQIGEETPTTPAISNFEIDDEFNLPISLAIFILVLYIFLGALIYCVWEEWNFFNSFYFVFISMSTVGFGDIVPGNPVCMIVSIVYLVFGLALMSMCINVVQLKLSDTFSKASNKIGATIGISVDDEDGSVITMAPDAVELPGVHQGLENGEASPSSMKEIDLT